MSNGRKVVVTDESPSGLNRRFLDTNTGDSMTRGQFASAIQRGDFPDYHVRVLDDGRRIPASNPNRSENDNLG